MTVRRTSSEPIAQPPMAVRNLPAKSFSSISRRSSAVTALILGQRARTFLSSIDTAWSSSTACGVEVFGEAVPNRSSRLLRRPTVASLCPWQGLEHVRGDFGHGEQLRDLLALLQD